MQHKHTAVLLIAHGSRRQAANDDLVQLAELVRSRGDYRCVETAYLDVAEPTIPQGITACVEHGVQKVLLLPYFLSAGAHATEDLQRHRREAAEQHPDVEFALCPPLGVHPLMVDIVFERLGESGE